MGDMDLGNLAMGMVLKMDQMLSAFSDIDKRMKDLEDSIKASGQRQKKVAQDTASATSEAHTKAAKKSSEAHQKSADEMAAAWAKAAKEASHEDDLMVQRLKENQGKIAKEFQEATRKIEAEIKKRTAEEEKAALLTQRLWERGESVMVQRLREAQNIMAAEAKAAAKAREADEKALAAEVEAIRKKEAAEDRARWRERVRAAEAALKQQLREEEATARAVAKAWQKSEDLMTEYLRDAQNQMAAAEKAALKEREAAAKAWQNAEEMSINMVRRAQEQMAREQAALARERERRDKMVADLDRTLEAEMQKATLSSVEYKIWLVRREERERLASLERMGLAEAEYQSFRKRIAESASAQIRMINEVEAGRQVGLFSGIARAIEGMSAAIIKVVRVAMGLTFVYLIGKGILDFFVGFNDELEQASIGLGVVINKYAEVRDAQGRVLDGEEKFNASIALGSQLVRQLMLDQLLTAATTEDMVDAAQKLSPMVFAAGGSMKQLRELTISATNAAKVLGIPIEQVAREINEIVTKGHVDARNTFGRMLNLSQQAKDEIARGPAQAMQVLIEATSKFNAAANTYSKSWSGLASSMTDLFKLSGADAGSGVFDLLKQGMQGVIDQMVEMQQTSEGTVPRIKDSWSSFLDGINANLTQFAVNWGSALASFNAFGDLGDAFSWIGDVIGNIVVHILPALVEGIGYASSFVGRIMYTILTPVRTFIDHVVLGLQKLLVLVAGISISASSTISKVQAVLSNPKLLTDSKARAATFARIDSAGADQFSEAVSKYLEPAIPVAGDTSLGADASGLRSSTLTDQQLKNKMGHLNDNRINAGNDVAAYQKEIQALQALRGEYKLTDHQSAMLSTAIANLESKIAKVTGAAKKQREALQELNAEMKGKMDVAKSASKTEQEALEDSIPIMKEYYDKLKAAGAAQKDLTNLQYDILAAQAKVAKLREEARQKAEKKELADEKAFNNELHSLANQTLSHAIANAEHLAAVNKLTTQDQIDNMLSLIGLYKDILDLYPDLYDRMLKKVDALRKKKEAEDKAGAKKADADTKKELTELEKEFSKSFRTMQGYVNKVWDTLQDGSKKASDKMASVIQEGGQTAANVMMNVFGESADKAFATAIEGGKDFGTALSAAGSAGMAALGPVAWIVMAIVAAVMLMAKAFQDNVMGIADQWNTLVEEFTNSEIGKFLTNIVSGIFNTVASLVYIVEIVLRLVLKLGDFLLGWLLKPINEALKAIGFVWDLMAKFFSWVVGHTGKAADDATKPLDDVEKKFQHLKNMGDEDLNGELDALQKIVAASSTSADDRIKAEERIFQIKQQLREKDIKATQDYYDELDRKVKLRNAKGELSDYDTEIQGAWNAMYKELASWTYDPATDTYRDPSGNKVTQAQWNAGRNKVINGMYTSFDEIGTKYTNSANSELRGILNDTMDTDTKNKVAALRAAGKNDEADALEQQARIDAINRDAAAKKAEYAQTYGANSELFKKLADALDKLTNSEILDVKDSYLKDALKDITANNPLPVKVVEMPPAFGLLSGSYFRMMSTVMNNALSISEGAIVVNGAGNAAATGKAVAANVKQLYQSITREGAVRGSMASVNALAGG